MRLPASSNPSDCNAAFVVYLLFFLLGDLGLGVGILLSSTLKCFASSNKSGSYDGLNDRVNE